MKYTSEITIELPRMKLTELFNNTENLHKWQEGLLSFELIEGEAGKEGAVSALVYEGRRGKLHMTETIVQSNFPDTFQAEYRARGVYNRVKNSFREKGAGATQWTAEHFFKFKGLMALMAPFMKSAFTSNTMMQMERFKTFAEQERSQ